jgi:predicted ATPase
MWLRPLVDRGLHQLDITNFRTLGQVTVGPLGRVNVLVGPNGSGKSTVLRVIQFLGDAARLQLGTAVRHFGGMERLRTRRTGKPGAVAIHIKANVTKYAHEGALDEYDLRLRSFLPDRFAHTETFSFKRTAKQGRRITLEGGRLHVEDEGRKEQRRSLDKDAFGLAVLPQLGEDAGGAEIRKIQQLFTTFRVFDIDARAARRPVDERDHATLHANGSNLAGFLMFLGDKHPAVFARLVEDARGIVPGLADIHLKAVSGPTAAVSVEIAEHHLPGATPLADASFGTVRALALLAMIHDPSPPLVTCVEEIDHGLHPHVFDRLVELLREASRRTQFLIATHSPALVNRLRPAELIVCERDPSTGLARIPAVDPEEVAAIRAAGEFGLGELWFSGTLGGVPK